MTRRMIFPLLLGLAGAAILIGLGLWQMQRLAWKEGILAEIALRLAEAPVDLPRDPDPTRDRYLSVAVTGRFTGQDLAVLVSRKQVGAGYRIIAGFETDAGRRIMIDRGFVAEADADKPRDAGAARIEGNLHWPEETDSYTPPPDPARGIWFARDTDAMARALGTEPVLIVARNTSENDPFLSPMPVDTSGIPNDHLHYAITWFSLALVWLGMTAGLLWRIRRQKD